MGKRIILTDRSRIQAYLDCPRYRYLGYHYPDEDGNPRGISKVEPSLPQVNGIFVHQALELILKGADVDFAIAEAQLDYMRSWDHTDPPPPDFVAEQKHLLECLVRAWVKFRMPVILEEYEVVSVEEEHQWYLDSQLVDMVRCDVVLRRKSDGLLFIMEFKTTSNASEDWAKQWEHNSQVLANTTAIEEIRGERVGGMLIEGLVKGRLVKDYHKTSPFYGQRIQQSLLCYAFKKSVQGGGSDAIYETTWSRGARKVRIWEEMTAAEWVCQLSEEELSSLFRTAGPIAPNQQDLLDWKEQTIAQEHEVDGNVAWVHEFDDKRAALNAAFPKNHNHCLRYYGYPCPMMDVCFNGAVAEDPIGSGLYTYRVPHHSEEKVGETVEVDS